MVYLQTVRVICHRQPSVLRRLASFSAATVGDARIPHANPTTENERVRDLRTDPAAVRKKMAQRGGQNLSARYQRLQTSLRGKEARAKEVNLLEKVVEGTREDAATALGLLPIKGEETQPKFPTSDSTTASSKVEANGAVKAHEGAHLFKGLVIPRKPDPPADDECCMSGCAICVYDLYEESLEAYDTSVAQVRKALIAMGVQEGEWPKSILPTKPGPGAQPSVQSTVRDAFEEMERALQKKKEARDTIALQTHSESTVSSSSINAAPTASQGSSMPAMASLSS